MNISSWIAKKIGEKKYKRLHLTKEENDKINLLVKSSSLFPIVTYKTLTQIFPDLESIAESKLRPFYDDLCFAACLFTCTNSIHKSLSPNKQNLLTGLFIKISFEKTNTNMNLVDTLFDIRTYVDNYPRDYELATSLGNWIFENLGRSIYRNEKLDKVCKNKAHGNDLGILIIKEFFDAWDLN